MICLLVFSSSSLSIYPYGPFSFSFSLLQSENLSRFCVINKIIIQLVINYALIDYHSLFYIFPHSIINYVPSFFSFFFHGLICGLPISENSKVIESVCVEILIVSGGIEMTLSYARGLMSLDGVDLELCKCFKKNEMQRSHCVFLC